jgi:hypothetical protein
MAMSPGRQVQRTVFSSRVLGLEFQVPELLPVLLLPDVHAADLGALGRVVVPVGVHRAQPAGQRPQRRVQLTAPPSPATVGCGW